MNLKKRTMRKTFILISVGLLLYSCGEKQSKKSERDIIESISTKRLLSNDDVTVNIAFIELSDYSYQDNSDYGKSSENRKLSIEGKTNFPEETSIKINIDGYIPSTKKEGASDTYGNAIVKNGQFLIELNPWNIPQTITFRIFKNNQPKNVLNVIGETGKKIKLSDENKADFPSICFFQEFVKVNEQLIDRLKKGKKIEYKFQTSKVLTNPVEKALANCANAWKNKNWNEMVKYTQKSQNETAKSLENMFGNVEIVGFKITNSKKNPDEYVKNWYSIEYEIKIIPMISHKGIQTKSIKANVINENGHWGVNAASATGGLYN